jgi:predicted CxxxxCH...CXXCH cytochrome family protein
MPLSALARAVGTTAIIPVSMLASLLAATPALAQTTCDPATSPLGAHRSHTVANKALGALSCAECHPPACTAGPPTVVFGELASRGGATPTWDKATRTCANVYCHGSTLETGSTGTLTWRYVDISVPKPAATECAMCHGYPPASHGGVTGCSGCHGDTVRADGTIDVAGGKHVNGSIDGSGGAGFGCNACHGYPPATGAHLAHFGLTDAVESGSYTDLQTLQDRYPTATPTTAPAKYAFGCANCHPLDGGRHMKGTVDVVLHDASAPAGSLKARNAAAAAYNPATKTCSGVYCHSTGQAGAAYVTTPGWFSGTRIGCNGCHANPPAYPSGGAGTATANSHLDLADDGYEFGHFLGMPGAWHTTKHGGNWSAVDDATAITCQTCHFDTTDPSNTGPSGFYYLDTTGNYVLPGGADAGWAARNQCGYCHKAGGAATGSGKVLPLRHVNGTRDVVFDPRTTLPSISWLPAAPNRPTRPYWVTDPGLSGYWPSGITWNGTTASFGLDVARYDTATKTCTNVGCHVAEAAPVWGRPYQYYTNSSATCYTCHPM